MDHKKDDIQRKYRDQIREKTEREKENGSSNHYFDVFLSIRL